MPSDLNFSLRSFYDLHLFMLWPKPRQSEHCMLIIKPIIEIIFWPSFDSICLDSINSFINYEQLNKSIILFFICIFVHLIFTFTF